MSGRSAITPLALDWIDTEIDAQQDELIRLCQDLVRIPSPNPPGDTTGVARYIKDRLNRSGIPFQEHLPRPENPILVSTLGSGSPRLVLNGHLDVFPVPDPGAWSGDPYSGALQAGQLCGRGASDMKAGVAAALGVFLLFARGGVHLDGSLVLTLVSDEENGGRWGTQWLLERFPELRGDACLIGEPTGWQTPAVGEKSPLWIKIRTHSPARHGAYSDGRDAVWQLARLVLAIQELHEAAYAVQGPIAPLAAELARRERESGSGNEWWLVQPSVNFGCIQGGVKVNVAPASAELFLDVRVPFGTSASHIIGELRRRIAGSGVEADMEIVLGEDENPNYSSLESPFWDSLRRAVIATSGQEPRPRLTPYLSDGRLYRKYGVETVLCGPQDYGMGAENEHIVVADYLNVVRIFAHTAANFCRITRQEAG
jgi:succinyl-diaminopimelate desuccinylase